MTAIPLHIDGNTLFSEEGTIQGDHLHRQRKVVIIGGAIYDFWPVARFWLIYIFNVQLEDN